MRNRLYGLGLLVAALGCSTEVTNPRIEDAAAEKVSAVRISGGILLTNESKESIAFLAYNPNSLALWAQCADRTPACLRLEAGSTLTIRDQEIEGFAAGLDEAAVLFWRVVPVPGDGYRPEEIKQVVVPLR
jgi:hypothetical protein